jgi:hypothetical protein
MPDQVRHDIFTYRNESSPSLEWAAFSCPACNKNVYDCRIVWNLGKWYNPSAGGRAMVRAERIYLSQSVRETRGKHKPSMLILGSFEKLKQDLIPALFRIATDHEIGNIDIIPSLEAVDLKRFMRYTLVFVAFDIYRDNESFFRMLPESIQDRVIILARPADFPSVAPEIKCACFSSELKALVPKEEAQLLAPHPEPAAHR